MAVRSRRKCACAVPAHSHWQASTLSRRGCTQHTGMHNKPARSLAQTLTEAPRHITTPFEAQLQRVCETGRVSAQQRAVRIATPFPISSCMSSCTPARRSPLSPTRSARREEASHPHHGAALLTRSSSAKSSLLRFPARAGRAFLTSGQPTQHKWRDGLCGAQGEGKGAFNCGRLT